MSALPQLSELETRVLGVLVEKERTVPDTYPLSLNALTLGCNQKNNRDPVMQAAEREVQAAIDALRPLSLVIESSGSRVMRYAHNFGRVLHVDDAPLTAQAIAVGAPIARAAAIVDIEDSNLSAGPILHPQIEHARRERGRRWRERDRHRSSDRAGT